MQSLHGLQYKNIYMHYYRKPLGEGWLHGEEFQLRVKWNR